MNEIDTVGDLMRAIQDQKTGGYDVEVNVWPNRETSRSGNGFFLVIEVTDSAPQENISGQYWFWNDDTVMQVL